MLKVSVKEEAAKNKKAKTVASLEVDLADYVSIREYETKTFALLGSKQKPSPTLRFKVRTVKGGASVPSVAAAAASNREIDEDGPFAGYATNALFKKMGGEIDAPPQLDATQQLLETAKQQQQLKKDETYTGNALFKSTDGEFKTPSKVHVSSSLQLLEESKAVTAAPPTAAASSLPASALSAVSSAPMDDGNPFGAAGLKSSSLDSPYGTPSASKSAKEVMSPSSEELQLLRRQNKLLQETLDKQEKKIEQLRQKMTKSSKSGSPPSPSVGGDAFLREKERTVKDLTTRLAESDKALAAHKALVATLTRNVELEKERAEKMGRAAEDTSQALAELQRRHDEAGVKLKLAGQQAETERQRAISAEAQMASKGGAETRARLAETEELRAKLAAAQREAEAERKRAVVAEKQTEEVKQKLASVTAMVETEKKKTATLESAQKQSSSGVANKDKQIEELSSKLADVTRELSGNQLTVIELSNRLRDAEALQGERKDKSQDGEVSSLQMQLVAMEQDYESQLDELRAELEEARAAGAGSGGRSLVSSSDNVRKSSSAVTSKRPKSGTDPRTNEQIIEQLRLQVADLERQKQELLVPASPMRGLGSRNPLMEPPRSSPFSSDEFDKLTSALAVMQTVQDCVWTARLSYDDRGVASAVAQVVKCLSDEELPPAVFERIAAAMETAAVAQQSVAGKFYWLNAATNLLDTLAAMNPAMGLQSPKEVGVLIVGTDAATTVPALRKQASSIKQKVLSQFVPRLLQVSFAIYRSVVLDVRSRTVGPHLAQAVFEPVMNARSALASRHNAGSVEVVSAELDATLRAATAAHIFPTVVKQFFSQVFFDIGAFLFNTMMKRQDLTATRAIAIKLEVSAFDNWPAADSTTTQNKDLLRNVSEFGMGSVKEVCNLLFIDKSTFLQRSALAEMCPRLNPRQVKSFLSAFVPDEICPEKTPLEVLDRLSADIKKTDALKLEESAWFPAGAK